MTRPSVAVLFGTRPEAIKLAPVIEALLADGRTDVLPISSGQHAEMLEPVLRFFGLETRHDLGVMSDGQPLGTTLARVLSGLDRVLERRRLGGLVVQGDTSTALGGALAGFYHRIPVFHVEAGLRSGDLSSPFPEELHRVAIGRAAVRHYAPTERARRNLLAEGLDPSTVVVTGNTVVDALERAQRRLATQPPELLATAAWRSALIGGGLGPYVLVTSHRRESFGDGLRNVCRAIRNLSGRHADLGFLWPLHLNRSVHDAVTAELAGLPRVVLVPPLEYPSMVAAMAECLFLLTDSGGVQEEAPALRKAVVILRDVTERPEVIESGFGVLVGTDVERIERAVTELLDPAERSRRTAGPNPFGDGHAGARIARDVADFLGAPTSPAG